MSFAKHPKASHLDVKRSLMVSSPAGSGKTQQLAERYVALLDADVPPERILAITFTEKAAAEMKARVLRILHDKLPDLHKKIQPKLSRFRISTVHAFAYSVLERFAFELDLPPGLEVIDAIESELMREEVIRDGLVALGGSNVEAALWVRHLTLTQGWTRLEKNIRTLFQHIPLSYLAFDLNQSGLSHAYNTAWQRLHEEWGDDFWQASGFSDVPSCKDEREHALALHYLLPKISPRFLTNQGILRKKVSRGEPLRDRFAMMGQAFLRYQEEFWRWQAQLQSRGLLEIFQHLAALYEGRKRKERVLDFGDLEYKLYQVLYHSSNWSNVLASFDEETDHILVDEFQDTNGLQWAIVTKLVEEWRSGMGAKQELGKQPTLFLVGDIKQSIYLFRGANVEVFKRAEREMTEWMREKFRKITVSENYRSLPLIVDFVNHLFSRLMSGGSEDWQTSYEEFRAMRDPRYQGCVELLLARVPEKTNMRDKKSFEAQVVAERIIEMVGNLPVFDRVQDEEVERQARFADIMILLRRRTHLERYEQALRQRGIPFVVVQGTGFHSSREIILLRQLVRFFSNPAEDSALYGILRSPLGGLDESEILEIAFSEQRESLWEKLGFVSLPRVEAAHSRLSKFMSDVDVLPSAVLLERVLRKCRLWSYCSDRQEAENIRKFIRILEDFDRKGLALFAISERLERMSTREEEPKANVNAQGMNAVRLMTIHAAKGLDSPVVFLVGLDDADKRTDYLAVREEQEKVIFTFTEAAYKVHPERLLWEAKQEEEMKRLLYVAATRARDALVFSAAWDGKASGWLRWLEDTLGLSMIMGKLELSKAPQGVVLEVRDATHDAQIQTVSPELYPEPEIVLERRWPEAESTFKRVSDEAEEKYHRGKGLPYLGEILHALLERVSKGSVDSDQKSLDRAIRSLVLSKGLSPSRVVHYQRRIFEQVQLLREGSLWERFILPKKDAESEMAFVFREREVIYTGRIDRVLIEPQGLIIIDYKSFPSNIEDVSAFTEQICIYAKAASELWGKPVLAAYILFTADAELVEVNCQ